MPVRGVWWGMTIKLRDSRFRVWLNQSGEFERLGKRVGREKVKLYGLQQFNPKETLDPEYGKLIPKTSKEINEIGKIMKKYSKKVQILGI